MARPPINALTGLRFVAAAHVIALHLKFGDLASLPELLKRFVDRGGVAVSLFFVLSGFVLTYRYQGTDSSDPAKRRFIIARIARVWPMYALGLAVSFPDFIQSQDQASILFAIGLVTILGLQAWLPKAALGWNFPGWSLSNEAFFYSIFLRMMRFTESLSSRRIIAAIAGAWALGQVPQVIYRLMDLPGPLWHNFFTYFPLWRLPEFFIGVAVGVVFLRDRGNATARRGATYTAIGATGSIIVASGVSGLPTILIDSESFLGPAFALLTYGLALGGGPLAWLLERNWIILLGNASYAMYILHVPIAEWAFRTAARAGWSDASSHFGFLFAVAATVALVAIPVHFLFERPARRFIVSLQGRHDPPPESPPA